MIGVRRLHLVGTLPQFEDPGSAFDWQLDALDGQLRRICGGETGPRLKWFVPLVKELKALSTIKSVRDGDWTGYDDTDRLAVRRGATLGTMDIPLRLVEYAREELELLAVRGDLPTADLPLQVGVPGYLDMALFIFGPIGVVRHARTFMHAVARQVASIHALAGDRVVFQLEVPAALIAVASTPPPLRWVLAELMAHVVVRQAVLAPTGSRFGVHLCLGDLGHRALLHPRTADPVVRLANAVVRRWPAGRVLDYVHLPMSGGNRPPSTTSSYYRPLDRLRLGDTRIVAGIAHEDQTESDQLLVRGLVERAVRSPVDIATSCGLGRRTPEQAARALARMRALLAD